MTTLAASFLIESYSFLQVTMACIKAWMSSNFVQIPPVNAPRRAYRMGLKPASVRLCIHSTLSIMNISETGRPIAIIFYMKHHLGREKAALVFGADQNRTQDPGDNKTYLPPTL